MTTIPEAALKVKSAAIGLSKILEKDRLARQAKPKIAAFFEMQKDLVLKELEALRPHFPEPDAKTQKAAPLPKIVDTVWQAIWENVSKDTTGTLQKIIMSVEQEGLIKGALQFKKIVPTDKSTFNLANPRAVAWFKDVGGSTKYITGMQDTTRDEIKTLITNALDKGQSYTQTAKEIGNAFDGMSRERAQTIAVYETAQAYESGNMMFAQTLVDDGLEMEKFYQTSEDDLVSELCQGNQDDDWIPIDEYHSSGVQQPPGHVRCRCYEKYREKGKEY